MKFEWIKTNGRLGYYELALRDDTGNTINGSEISFVDYTGDTQRELNKDNPKLKDVAYSWQWCFGYYHSEDYLFSENLTLEQAQKRAEDWLAEKLTKQYETACSTVQMLKPFVDWVKSNRE